MDMAPKHCLRMPKVARSQDQPIVLVLHFFLSNML